MQETLRVLNTLFRRFDAKEVRQATEAGLRSTANVILRPIAGCCHLAGFMARSQSRLPVYFESIIDNSITV